MELDNFDRLLRAAESPGSNPCPTPEYSTCVPASVIRLVRVADELGTAELSINDPDHFVELKKYLHIAAYSIGRTALVYPIFDAGERLIGLRLTVTTKRWKD